MNIICSDTNATLGGVSLPVGAYEWPESGTVMIVTSSGYSNNVTAGATDAVVIDRLSVTVSSGPDPVLWFVAGLTVTLSQGVIIGFLRYLFRSLGGLGRVEW